MSIMEEVLGFGNQIAGQEAELIEAMRQFKDSGYAFSHAKRNSQHYLLPSRRNRIWMLAVSCELIGSLPASKSFLELVEREVTASEKLNTARLELFMVDMKPAKLTDRERKVLKSVLSTTADDDLPGLVADISQSEPPVNFNAVTCITTSCKLYHHGSKQLFGPVSKLQLQGLFEKDFPAFGGDPVVKKQVTLFNKIAGEAFSSTTLSCYLAAVLMSLIPLGHCAARLSVVVLEIELSLHLCPDGQVNAKWKLQRGESLVVLEETPGANGEVWCQVFPCGWVPMSKYQTAFELVAPEAESESEAGAAEGKRLKTN